MKKHLTLSDRIIIEQKLNEGTSIREIARTVNKDASTIIREIHKRKCPKGKRSIKVLPACANKPSCSSTPIKIFYFLDYHFNNNTTNSQIQMFFIHNIITSLPFRILLKATYPPMHW